jgi:hypothetical protein
MNSINQYLNIEMCAYELTAVAPPEIVLQSCRLDRRPMRISHFDQQIDARLAY